MVLQQGILCRRKYIKEMNKETYASMYLVRMMIIKSQRRLRPMLEHVRGRVLRHVLRWIHDRLVRRQLQLAVLGRLLVLHKWLIPEQLLVRIRIELLAWNRILAGGRLMHLLVLLIILVRLQGIYGLRSGVITHSIAGVTLP